MGWLITLGVLILLAIAPLGVSAVYDAQGLLLRVIAGPVRITLLPKKQKDSKPKKEKKPKQSEKKKQSKAPKPKTAEPKKAKGGSLTDFLPLVQTALDMLVSFKNKLRVNRLEMKLIMAADDPCDLAVNYGRAWAALGNLMPQLERIFVIKKRDLEVECDFTSDKTLIIARLDLTITLGRLISLVVVYGIRLLREYLNIMNKRKGGAKT